MNFLERVTQAQTIIRGRVHFLQNAWPDDKIRGYHFQMLNVYFLLVEKTLD
ncbi:hypothetical protein L484_001016 [Morus notabilis]|uniref:Uncharacterized protein n=1 Tax=Morus notabilis TaxID=981085 RepID=W9RA87_9ROSA|nr:hypothetical protein L484_001016 [Morus notabilis]